MKTAVVRYCDTSVEANLIRNRLEKNGIKSYLWNENFTTLMPHLNYLLGSGIRVIVEKSDLEKAVAIVGDGASKALCPDCGSENLTQTGVRNKMSLLMILLSAIVFLPIGNLLKEYQCDSCQHIFRI